MWEAGDERSLPLQNEFLKSSFLSPCHILTCCCSVFIVVKQWKMTSVIMNHWIPNVKCCFLNLSVIKHSFTSKLNITRGKVNVPVTAGILVAAFKLNWFDFRSAPWCFSVMLVNSLVLTVHCSKQWLLHHLLRRESKCLTNLDMITNCSGGHIADCGLKKVLKVLNLLVEYSIWGKCPLLAHFFCFPWGKCST